MTSGTCENLGFYEVRQRFPELPDDALEQVSPSPLGASLRAHGLRPKGGGVHFFRQVMAYLKREREKYVEKYGEGEDRPVVGTPIAPVGKKPPDVVISAETGYQFAI